MLSLSSWLGQPILWGHPAGVLGAAVLPVVGVGVGVTQMVRGVANTPEAIKETRSGKQWDKVRRALQAHSDAMILTIMQ